MATSGTTGFSVTESDVVTDALQNIGVIDAGSAASGEDLLLGRRKLNMLVKQWVAQADFAPGLKMWTRRRGILFLQKDQIQYELGPTGDECASESFVRTTLTAGAALGASTITVASITGLASSMRIGVLLASGSIQWTTINGAPSGSTVTLAATLTGAASSGATVFAYTSKILRPFEIVTGVRRDSSDDDTPIDVNMSLDEYEMIPSKTSVSAPSGLYFEGRRTNARVYLNAAPDDLTNVIRFVYLSYIEDFSASTNDADLPAEWFRALSAQLSIDCCLPFGRSVTPELKMTRDEAIAMARNAYPSTSDLYYQSEPDSY